MPVIVGFKAEKQPPLFRPGPAPLVMVINGLALGGAEKIVLDWAARTAKIRPVRLVALRDAAQEYPVPIGVDVVRFGGRDIPRRLRLLGRSMARDGHPVCLCHLLRRQERDALTEGGAMPVPVLHNAAGGWLEDAAALASVPRVIAVSDACARDLRDAGYRGGISVIRHIPSIPDLDPRSRRAFRKDWRVPKDAFVLGMIGAVKPQKNYPFALDVLDALRRRRDAYLVIVGGPVGRNGERAWKETLRAIEANGLRRRVAMPGFIPDASRCLAAFDVFLNTSDYEGFSMAIQEALLAKLPTVARKVGGQEETDGELLTLIEPDAPVEAWADAVEQATARPRTRPSWATFPAYRLWTLAELAKPYAPNGRTLFVTANLNAGGAQRSLVNLATSMRRRKAAIAVCGDSTAEYFQDALRRRKVPTFRTAASKDPFDHAESVVEAAVSGRCRNIVFWNADPKVKLLVAKALAHTAARIIDVSPGGYAFEEMESVREFGRRVAFGPDEFYARLDRLVLKYHGGVPAACLAKTTVIPNGVNAPRRIKTDYAVTGPPRIAVNGRIAPSKFLLEIIEAVRLARKARPGIELHVHGSAEPRFAAYAEEARRAAEGVAVFHGADAETPDKLHAYDLFVVLGRHQGCPNALLEAMAAGLPCVANDDGGTSETLVHRRNGLLLPDVRPEPLAETIVALLNDRAEAARLGNAARTDVAERHSMASMTRSYLAVFDEGRASFLTRIVRYGARIRNLTARSAPGTGTAPLTETGRRTT